MKATLLGATALALALFGGCTATPVPQGPMGKADLQDQTQVALQQFRQADPSLKDFLDTCYAYVIFPKIDQGALVFGGGYGRGQVFRNGQWIGWADVSQANIGAQIGGQSYSEIIFFQNVAAYDEFRNGQLTFDARASAVAASAGAATTADYQRGVAVFTLAQSGLMAQAAVGGQQFRFSPATGIATDSP